MPEEQVQTPPAPPPVNPFASNAWDEQPTTPTEAVVETPVVTPVVETPVTPTTPAEEILEPNVWLKREFGFENIENAKTEIEALRKLKEQAATPQEIKFANEQSEKFFNSLKEGKEDDVYEYLSNKKKLERAEKLDVTNAVNAAELLKLNFQYKYKDQGLTGEEINDLFHEQYAKPPKPEQGVDQEDEDYKAEVSKWKQQCEVVDKRVIRDAKIQKPELVKYKADLAIPDLPKKEVVANQPSQEDLAAEEAKLKAVRDGFLNKLESDFSKVEGFSTKVKDEEVELPIVFNLSPEEQLATKQELSDFNINDYIEKRWFDANGNPNVNQMMKDKYVLENLPKLLDGVANKAATARLLEYRKQTSNVRVNGGGEQQTFNPSGNQQNVNPFSQNAWSEVPPVRTN
jgi:hypothetical protein